VGEAEPEVAELEARVVQALVRLVQAARARAPLVPRQEEVLVQQAVPQQAAARQAWRTELLIRPLDSHTTPLTQTIPGTQIA
jgi:hypothetical protein